MKKFKIEVKKSITRKIEVSANSKDEAVANVEELYKQGIVLLDDDNLVKVEFNILDKSLLNEKSKLINDVIDYLIRDEKKHFEETEKPKDHIYRKLISLKKLNS